MLYEGRSVSVQRCSVIQPGYILVMFVRVFHTGTEMLSFSRQTLCQHALVLEHIFAHLVNRTFV